MSWILISIIARFLDSGVIVLDKLLLKHTVFKPVPYVFYTGILSIFTIVFIVPLSYFIKSLGDFSIPNISLIFFDFLIGFILLAALFFLFSAFSKTEITRASTLVGSLIPIFTLGLSFFAFGELLSAARLLAFIFLVGGSLLMVFGYGKIGFSGSLPYVIFAAFLWALFFVFLKMAFERQSFVTTVFWFESGVFAGAFLMLFIPGVKNKIFNAGKSFSVKKSHLAVFIFNKIIARISSLLIIFSVNLGDVTLVNALEGVKYAFVFLIAIILSVRFPNLLKEELTFSAVLRKTLAVVLIGAGIFMLI